MARKTFDLVGAIMDYESGELGEQETIDLFQHLVDTDTVNQLQGSYQRTARALIDAGLVTVPRETEGNYLQGARPASRRH